MLNGSANYYNIGVFCLAIGGQQVLKFPLITLSNFLVIPINVHDLNVG